MDKKFTCRDFGMECDYRVCARTEEQVLKNVWDHVQTVHQMKRFSKEDYEKARAAIHEGSWGTEEKSPFESPEGCFIEAFLS